MVHFTTVSLTLWLGGIQLMIRQLLSLLVMPRIITQSGLISDQHGRDAVDFYNLSGCEQLGRGSTHC